MLKTFIQRPVLSTVISIIIVVLGLIGLYTLPVSQYPDIAPPTIRVVANYSGANAAVVMNSVIIPLEEQINGVENMTYMTSSASNNGQGTITIFFKQGTNPDIAAVNVQNLVARATPLLPQEVVSVGVSVQKSQSSTLLFMALSSSNPDYDSEFLQNYANINIIPQVKRIPGVGDAQVYGTKDYSMRIWLKPDVMAVYGLDPSEVIAALRDQNIEAAPGEIGQNSNQSFQYTLKYTGRLKSSEEFENIIVRSSKSLILRIKDVARVELGALDYSVESALNGNTSMVMTVSQTAGSNAQEIIDLAIVEIDQVRESLPPGVNIDFLYNANDFLDASINKVIITLIEAFLLVFLVVFLFLQDFRSTLIPAIAVPVAIIGTFFFLQIFGFTINLLTLFALVLAIGIVVDDAIVVVEAVHAQMDAGEKSAKKATMKAMTEIAPAIVSITLVMSAVFIPVSFIGGTTGVFYKQFGLTLAIAIIISAVNALTLSPALCALFLKPNHNREEGSKSFIQRFYYYFNITFDSGTKKYKKSLQFLGKKKNRWITIAIISVSSILLIVLMKNSPSEFVPQEDSGGVIGIISLPPGSSLQRTEIVVEEVAAIVRSLPGVNNVNAISGMSFISGAGSSYGTLIIKMLPWEDRKITAEQLQGMLFQKTAGVQEADLIFFGMPTLQGFGFSNGFEFKLQDKTGGDIGQFYGLTGQFLGALNQRPEIQYAMTTFNPNFPQYEIEADVAKIKDAGLTLSQVMSTLQAYIGSMYISNFNLYGKQFRVMIQADPEYRAQIDDLAGMFVKTASGEMAPITEFIKLEKVSGPQAINRFNLYTSMDIMGAPAPGYSTGEAIKAIEEVAAEMLPQGYGYDYSGMTREEVNSTSQTWIIFALSILFVFLLLAALYESYIIPLSVILSLPIGLSGVFIFTNLFGVNNNIYVQISLIMLIGLLAKNAILIVEYAMQRRKAGMSIVDAAINGAVARLRPILMTSFAFIFGLMPLMFSSGAGAIGNRSIGVSAIGGMLIGTMIGILVVPSLYIIFQYIQERFSGPPSQDQEEI
ncbi:multidrug efflux system protein [Bacteroidales bacterium]|nr:multidrug efflux system protein [Bacteroidales bacterium]